MNTPMNLPYVGFSIEAALRQAWEVTKKRYPFLLAAVAVFVVSNMAFGMVGGLLQAFVPRLFGGGEDGQIAAIFAAGLWNIASTLFIAGPLMCSSYYVGVAARRGEPFSYPALFRGFYHYGSAIKVYLLAYILILAALIAGALPSLVPFALSALNVISDRVGLIIFLCLLAPGALTSMYVTLRLSPALMLAVDDDAPRLGAWATVKTAWRWTGPPQWHLMLLSLIALFIMLATMACFFLPFVFVGMPYLTALVGVVYAQLGADQGLFPVKDRCAICHYHLKGIKSGVCPECGTPVGTL
jgi:hypothetical protein